MSFRSKSAKTDVRRRRSRRVVGATVHSVARPGGLISRAALLAGSSMLALLASGVAPLQAAQLGGAVNLPAPNYSIDAATVAAQQAAALAVQGQSAMQRSIQAIQAMQGAQAAARAAAAAAQRSATLPQITVPNGLGAGGLQVAPNATWSGASAPVQSTGGNGTLVTIDQTAPQAILNWQSFNVGAQTTVNFNQQASTWTALNRVVGDAAPSQILGQITAPGQVLVINQNGIIFGGASQINVGSLVASTAAMTDQQFLTKGIYSNTGGSSGYLPSFTGAGGKIIVENGALITTIAPASATSGGGFVALLGTEVRNAGTIATPKGQALLAAGDDFVLRAGYGTAGNQFSSTNGNEVAPILYAGSASGTAGNTGLIFAQQGDITLAGRTLIQDGVLLSTTSVNQRGTIHLLNSASDTSGSVTLTGNSLNVILPELASSDTALNSQRDAMITASGPNTLAIGLFDNLSTLGDRKDQSRVEIVTGGLVNFQNGSVTTAQGGQIAVSAGKRVFTANGATLDVSGVRGVLRPMSANGISVNIQGNELRDSPDNRDSGQLFNQNVWIDARSLTLVPAGTGGYATDRYYTAGGLLEVSGYLSNTPHTIGEWTAVGGTITLSAPQVVAQQGSIFNISGGSVTYQGGFLPQSFVLGSDGRVYNINTAPANLTYSAVVTGFVVLHNQGGKNDPKLTEIYASLLGSGGRSVWQDGYTIGRDAGQIILSTPTTMFEGKIIADVISGLQQVSARPANVTDGYKLTQSAAPLAGTLALGQYNSYGLAGAYNTDVKFDRVTPVASQIGATDALAADRTNTAYFDAPSLNSYGLGGLNINTGNKIAVDAPLSFAPGAQVKLTAPVVDIAANMTAPSGNVRISNILNGAKGDVMLSPAVGNVQLTLESGVTIDTRGLWVNGARDPGSLSGLAFLNGGNVTFDATGNVTLAGGSTIDVSSGGAILANGKTQGGKGGNVTVIAGDTFGGDPGDVTLSFGSAIRAYGVTGGGTLTISSPGNILIGDNASLAGGVLAAGTAAPLALQLTSPLTIPTGMPLPFTLIDRHPVLTFDVPTPIVIALGDAPIGPTAKPWTVPTGMEFGADVNGVRQTFTAGTTLPAGAIIRSWPGYASVIPAGTTIPSEVFPNGFSIVPYQLVYAAGSVQAQPMTYITGTIVPIGTVLPFAANVAQANVLGASLFSSGFANYDINGGRGVLVSAGTAVAPTMPVYRFTDASFSMRAGSDPASALSVWLPPLFLENPQAATLTQRGGASLALRSLVKSGNGSGGAIVIGDGASIAVDPGQGITLDAFGQITVNGNLTARGGTITMVNEANGVVDATRNFDVDGNGRGVSIWIGADSTLDVSGLAYRATDAAGRPYGVASDGGTISLNGGGAFVVLRPGAELNADGTQVAIDLSAGTRSNTPSQPLNLASNGGSIVLSSWSGLYLDGDMHAAAGDTGAAGGNLSIALVTPTFPDTSFPRNSNWWLIIPPNAVLPSVLTVQTGRPSALVTDSPPGMPTSSLVFGQATVSTDMVKAGGFSSLSLSSGDYIQFAGNVSLALGRSLTLNAASYASGPAVSGSPGPSAPPANGTVQLSAPYIRLQGNYVGNIDNKVTGTILNPAPSGLPTTATFEADANQIDIQGLVAFSASAPNSMRAPGFSSVRLVSQGDMRFLATTAPQGTTLQTDWNLDLIAAQIYPATNVVASVFVGQNNVNFDPNNTPTLTIGRSTAIIPDAPLSVFGSLTLGARVIEQGGILRAPFGSIQLGQFASFSAGAFQSQQVDLLPGSLTSVSMAGLTIPYGGTLDGVTYTYNGASVTSKPLTNMDTRASGITIDTQSSNVQSGAVLDLSGGGTLAGAGFVSGRGGSVNVLNTPLVSANPTMTLSKASDKVYAIVPGYGPAYAPVAPENGAGDPVIGQQITIPAGVPGLPAGTYTLLPSNYALLPGAYRVELGAPTTVPVPAGLAVSNGTYVTSAYTGIANTGIRSSLPSLALISPGTSVRRYSQYNEQSYSDFMIASAQRFGNIRPLLPADGKSLFLTFETPTQQLSGSALVFDGTALFQAGAGGAAGQVLLKNVGEIYADAPTQGFANPSVRASDLDAIAAPRLLINGLAGIIDGTMVLSGGSDIFIRDGVTLKAAELFLFGGNITIGNNVVLTTVGQGPAPYDSASLGVGYSTSVGTAVLALSNGDLQFLGSKGTGAITVGAGSQLYSEGTLAFATNGVSTLDPAARFGSRNITLAVGTINIGDDAAVAAAGSPAGLLFNQALFNTLVNGDPTHGAPALQTITLSAANAINVFGSTGLDATAAGINLTFNTPAIYGYGSAGDSATIAAGRIAWNGIAGATPPQVIVGGAGSGAGTLNLVASEIDFGKFVSLDTSSASRVVYGFGNVNLVASKQIVSAGNSSLFVYQAPSTAAGAVFGQSGTGGNLTLSTPLLTGVQKSIMAYAAGGVLNVVTPAGLVPSPATSTVSGAEIDLGGDSVAIASTILLPSGKLVINATNDITLNAGSRLDLSGQPSMIQRATVYGFGGTVILNSAQGGVTQAAGSVVDVSAVNANAGSITVNAGNGAVAFGGALNGAATAGSTSGAFSVTAGTLADFAGLNTTLNQGGFFDSRSFDVRNGDLVIGDGVRAHNVTVSVDGGSLTVAGTIDASGASPGTIRLSAINGLTLASTAVLDAHGTVLQVDSYTRSDGTKGQPIEAKNRGHVELTATRGQLVLASGATIDLSTPDGVAYGEINLNASRTGETSGDININASGPLNIRGAQSLAVNGFWTYAPTDAYGTIVQDNRDTSPVSASTGFVGLKQIDAQSQTFMTLALSNTDLLARLSGLRVYASAFHLRPGVEIDGVPSAANPTGTLTVAGDLDLAGLRYQSLNPNFQKTGIYGSGEPGALVLRASGNLDIVGSISDGFMSAPTTPDDNSWVLQPGVQRGSTVTLLPLVLSSGTSFPNTSGLSLRYAISINPATIRAYTAIPVPVTLAADVALPAGTRLTGNVLDGSGNVLYPAGTVLGTATTIPAGAQFDTGSVLPTTVGITAMTWPAGTSLGVFTGAVTTNGNTNVPFEGIIPAGTNVQMATSTAPTRPTDVSGRQGGAAAIAAMLPQGSLSWSMRLVSGADLSAADTRIVQPVNRLKASGASGNLTLTDGHQGSLFKIFYYYGGNRYYVSSFNVSGCQSYTCIGVDIIQKNDPLPSVVRTGTGNLDLIAGGSFSEQSLYGVYTAGTQSAAITASDGSNPYNQPRGLQNDGSLLGPNNSGRATAAQIAYQAWYPEHGGDVLVSAQGDITGNIALSDNTTRWVDTDRTSNWLWRQGGGGLASQPTSWWINFGTYAWTSGTVNSADASMVGFQGIGALGGGNLTVIAGRNAGVLSVGTSGGSTGLDLAVASTGRVLPDGTLVQTGGGDLVVKIGGVLNPAILTGSSTAQADYFGSIADLRGNITINAGAIGALAPGVGGAYFSSLDPRTLDANTFKRSYKTPGPMVTPGDGTVNITTRGDLVLGGAADAGMGVPVDQNGLPYTLNASGTSYAGGAASSFALWTPATSISLYAAGGDVAPLNVSNSGQGATQNGNGFYPGTLIVAAANGDIRFAEPGVTGSAFPVIELMPSPFGQLELLASGSIYGSTQVVAISGAAMSSVATPFHPIFAQTFGNVTAGQTNASPNSGYVMTGASPIAFGQDTATNLHAGDTRPALIYAGVDIVDLIVGQSSQTYPTLDFKPESSIWYTAAKPFQMIAGRDIVGTGTTPNVFFNIGPNDISLIRAGRDIIYQSVTIAGPGLLDVEAGRNLYQGYYGTLASVGDLLNSSLSKSNGAGITTVVGTGANGPDYSAFAKLYFNAANQLPSDGTPLASSGKVVQAYDQELLTWLKDRFGYTGTADNALAFFLALPAEQQGIFVRQVYYAELTAGGREYNDPTSPRSGSYLRGREAIAALFPSVDQQGKPITYTGSLTMFSGLAPNGSGGTFLADAGIRTEFGGDIQILAPGGQTLVGVEGVTPGAKAGLITQGAGNIDIYSLGSVLLGQSRVMTTFGGNILVWSATGDINAGRGSKTTTIFSPPKRVYDGYGNVTLAPTAPSSGAGFATLQPLPQVSRGNIDLVAPLGTIDLGEAGVRFSGNLNLAALQVVNAANISGQGTVTGIPTVQGPPTSALTSANNATAANQQAAAPAPSRNDGQASIIMVEVMGYGGGGAQDEGADDRKRERRSDLQDDAGRRYDRSSAVQFVGLGRLSADEKQDLTEGERMSLAGQQR